MEFGMNNFETTELGKIKIAPQVIEVIARLSTIDLEGVAGLSGNFSSGIKEFFGNKEIVKGIEVEVGTKETAVDIYVIIEYGYSIPVLAEKIQENVKNNIETMTGLNVVEVNIHINGIHFKDDNVD